jgi:hypothetical protein
MKKIVVIQPMKYLKHYEALSYKSGDYVTLNTTYGNYYNKFYEIIDCKGFNITSKWSLRPLFDKDEHKSNGKGYIVLHESQFSKCTDSEIEEIKLKLVSDKYNI